MTRNAWRRTAFWLAGLMCLAALAACGGAPGLAFLRTATATPTISLTPTLAFTPSQTPTPSSTPTWTPTSSQTLTPSATLTASPSPTPTETYQYTLTPSLSPTRTRPPSLTPTITRTRSPSSTPTITLTPTAHPAALRIRRPGAFSKVVSPLQVEAMIMPGEDGLMRLELIGEDGRRLHAEDLNFSNWKYSSIWVYPEVPYAISAAAESARLVLSTRDRFQRVMFLASVDVILQSVGRNEVYGGAPSTAPYILRSPPDGGEADGGVLQLEGVARPVNNTPLIIELVDESGRVLTAVQAVVPYPAAPLSHTPFSVSIPYRVDAPTPVRVVLRQESDGRIPGTVALASIRLTLNP